MPVNEDGISPDIIINPHAIPSRMTCAMLMEIIMGHLPCLMGTEGDGTPFNSITIEMLSKMLESNGLDPLAPRLGFLAPSIIIGTSGPTHA